MLITKEFSFDMAHRLPNHEGKCRNIHGHTYKMQVALKGDVKDTPGAPDEGMLIDFTALKNLVNRFIDLQLDHMYLCYDKDLDVKKFLQDNRFAITLVPFIPTAENMTEWIFNSLREEVERLGVELYSIKIWETPTSFAEFKASSYKDN